MHIEVSHRHLSTAAEVRANAVAVRKRLMGVKPKSRPAIVANPALAIHKQVIEVQPVLTPLWMREDIWFHAHIVDRNFFRARPMAAFIAKRAAELGTSYIAIVGGKRLGGSIKKARDIIAAELKDDHDLPWTELGRLFRRDHTSIFYGVHEVWAERGEAVSQAKLLGKSARMHKDWLVRKAAGKTQKRPRKTAARS